MTDKKEEQTKDLKDKAIDIKGKKYVLVSDRIIYFNETYPNGTIDTQLITEPSANMVIVRACVTPDVNKITRFFTGYSQAVKGQGVVNTTAALENAETSAVGRALAMMGIGVIDSVASVDEINKAQVQATYMPSEHSTQSKPSFGKKVETGPLCQEHNTPYIKFEKNGRSWYSHKLDDGTWCNKPKDLPVVEDFPDSFPTEEV